MRLLSVSVLRQAVHPDLPSFERPAKYATPFISPTRGFPIFHASPWRKGQIKVSPKVALWCSGLMQTNLVDDRWWISRIINFVIREQREEPPARRGLMKHSIVSWNSRNTASLNGQTYEFLWKIHARRHFYENSAWRGEGNASRVVKTSVSERMFSLCPGNVVGKDTRRFGILKFGDFGIAIRRQPTSVYFRAAQDFVCSPVRSSI